MGAVARLAGAGVTGAVTGDTGEVASLGCMTPAPGLARRVMRTVSFFRGTALVFGPGGGVGGVGVSLISLGEGNWKGFFVKVHLIKEESSLSVNAIFCLTGCFLLEARTFWV
jgi:hypothetical protein